MAEGIAIVGLACEYPDARTPTELWENALSQRRAFRRIPSERLCLDDYHAADRLAEDRTYATEAALIEGYEFDRLKFRVVGSTHRQADLTHWLALDVASRCLEDAECPEGRGLPRPTTGVIVGNSLTGEFSRANLMRLRWPYVRRIVESALAERDWSPEQRRSFLERLEPRYKEPFPAVGDETLAGGLSNTIAGRICNQFDFQGGGYTVDGACASSLLAVAQACNALVLGDLDVALAGGVDLSLDPFELVGFAKVGALASETMRVFDARSDGFWPGEGCGFIMLMRHEDAAARGLRIYAVIRGWGVSSDGSGGITRPEVEGQRQALRRAYRRAGFGVETVAYFEGHGTGTPVGDETELEALSGLRREADPEAPPAALGSIKANIGHTKAAAGVAGLIKATLAVHHQWLPPTTGCETPHALLTGAQTALKILREPHPWPADRALRAGVSAMGFGGINTHIALENPAPARPSLLHPVECPWTSSPQDAEIFLFQADSVASLRTQLNPLQSLAAGLSGAELTDLAATLAGNLSGGNVRAALIATTPREFANQLDRLQSKLNEGCTRETDFTRGIFLGRGDTPPRLGFLFPGQASPSYLDGGAYRRRFAFVRDRYADVPWQAGDDGTQTDVAQPAVVTASLVGLELLDRLGIAADLAVGHSLGELTALHWAGACSADELLRLAAARGRSMADHGASDGIMAALHASPEEVEVILAEISSDVVIAGRNSPKQTVISGGAAPMQTVMARARARGWQPIQLPVSRAFHSARMAASVPLLRAGLNHVPWNPLRRRVLSSVTGAALPEDADVSELLCRQVTEPVRFIEAIQQSRRGNPEHSPVDVWIEVGPGRVLAGLVADVEASINGHALPIVVSMDACGDTLRGWLETAAVAFCAGVKLRAKSLFDGRFTRPFPLDRPRRFFANPCETAPLPPDAAVSVVSTPRDDRRPDSNRVRDESASHVEITTGDDASAEPLALVRQLIADRTELPRETILEDHRMLSDLHLNSITVGQIVGEAARRLALPPVTGLNEFANATVAQMARALEEWRGMGSVGTSPARDEWPEGVESWICGFTVSWLPADSGPSLAKRSSQTGKPPRAVSWKIISETAHPLAGRLEQDAGAWEGEGIVVCLAGDEEDPPAALLLAGAKALAQLSPDACFVLVQPKSLAGGFARTLHLEMPGTSACVIQVPLDHPQAVAWIRSEIASVERFAEVKYDERGTRLVPRWQRWTPGRSEKSSEARSIPELNEDDVLLVTGGGKGIAAECALALGRRYGVRLVLMGRSSADSDSELRANLERMTSAGLACRYVAADVCDAVSVHAALERVREEWGKITAFLHGAGTNEPKPLASMDAASFARTLSPKIQGFRNVMAGLGEGDLKLLVTFGSIIARLGLPGEADYAVANEWLRRWTEEFQTSHPRCRCVALEWSIWSGVGMGQRFGRVETLRRQGIDAIPPETGVRWLLDAVAQPNGPTSIVIAGRFGNPPTLEFVHKDLPLLRFLERTRVHIPGVELIVEATLSSGTDPYLADHVYHGERLLPAVMGLEAMAQAAMALVDSEAAPQFEGLELARPVVVPKGGTLTVRVAALLREDGALDVVLRTDTTGFHVNHFSVRCRFAPSDRGAEALMERSGGKKTQGPNPGPLGVRPRDDLYGGLFFHGGRFRRVVNYRMLRATECIAQLEPDADVAWFGSFLPGTCVLGDAGVRDAAIHAIQACIPHARLLPVSVGRITLGRLPCLFRDRRRPGPRPVLLLHARERSRQGDVFHYDLALKTDRGELLEAWEDLCLRRVDDLDCGSPWLVPLLAPYLERRCGESMPGTQLRVALAQGNEGERRERSRCVLREALRQSWPIRYRPDGKPEVDAAWNVSAAHAADLTLGVAAPASETVGCDLETVSPKSEATWRDLLGTTRWEFARRLSGETSESLDRTATRIWTVLECLKKAGAPAFSPLTLIRSGEDGWMVFGAGGWRAASYAAALRGRDARFIATFLSDAAAT